MCRRRVLAVRVVAIAAVAVTSVVFALSGARLRAQNPEPLISKTVPKEAPLPTPDSEPVLSQLAPRDEPKGEPLILPPSEPKDVSRAPAAPELKEIPPIVDPTATVAEPPLTPSRVLPTPSTVFADPEAAANGFVERTTKEADEAVRTLTKEAESLRTRLQKVEAGLSRWKAVKAALESNGGHAAWSPRTPTVRQPIESDVLDPIPGPTGRRPIDSDVLEPIIPPPVVEPPISRSRSLPAPPDSTPSKFEVDPAQSPQRRISAPVHPTELDPIKSDTVSPPPIAPTPTPAPKPDPALDKK